jgi:FHS family glucose/mannose:H+ symporter-like MFS transporter
MTFRVLGPVFFYFLAAGIATVMLGPLLPSLIQHWQIHDAQAGVLFTASFAGQICGAWFAARNLKASILYGAALSAMGCVVVPMVSFAVAPVAFFCIGVGLGAGLSAGNVIVGTAVTTSRARLIAALNVAWGLGAIACPVLVRLTLSGGLRLFFLFTGVFLAIACLFAITIPQAIQPLDKAAENSYTPSPITRAYPPLTNLTLFVFAAAMFLYIGVENSLGGWLPSYAVRTNPTLKASSVALCFWAAELAGRLFMAALNTSVGEVGIYRACLAFLIFAEVLLCTAQHLTSTWTIVLSALCGLALAPLYPLIVSFMLARTGKHPRLGALFACASLGGASLPWLTGVLSSRFHGLRAGLLVPALGSGLLLSLSSVLSRKTSLPRKH